MKGFQMLAGAAIAASAGVFAADGAAHVIRSTSAIDSLASPTGVGAAEPNLVIGKKGELYLSWLEPVDSGYALKLAAWRDGRWTSPSIIRSGRDFFVNWADIPSVAVRADGKLAAHWLQRTGKPTYAYEVRIVQSSDEGRTWTAPITPHLDTQPVEHGFVAMWPERDGLGAVWLDGRATAAGPNGQKEMMLLSSSISPDGTVGAEQTLDTRTCDCCQNAAAIAEAGPVIAYRDRTTDEVRDIYVTRRVNGKWSEGKPVHADNWKINACPVNGPAIEAAGRNIVVAWFTGARDTNQVKVAFSNDGGATFGAPVRVDGGQPGGRVDLVLLDDGSAVVSWLERTGGDAAVVQARRVTRDGHLGAPKTIATSSASRTSGVPRMVRNGSVIYFAWTFASLPSRVRMARASVRDFR